MLLPQDFKEFLSVLDGVPVSIIGIEDLRTNKKAAGRHKDIDDLENLPVNPS